MSSSSSTSSSESGSTGTESVLKFSQLETAPRSRIPIAALGLVFAIIVVEQGLSMNVDRFADQAAWQWREKKRLIDAGQLDGDVAIIGTSVLFHSIDAEEVNRLTRTPLTVTNLALNGMALHAQTQMLEDLLRTETRSGVENESGRKTSSRIRHVLLELRSAVVEKKNWVAGPYFREWSRFEQFAESGFVWFEPSKSLSFATNRALTSFNFRRSIDNFIFSVGQSSDQVEDVRGRNAEVSEQIQSSRGFCKSGSGDGLTAADTPEPEARPWQTNHAGEVWLHRLLNLCRAHGIRVTLLQPPAPPFVRSDRVASNFSADFEAFVANLQQQYPKTIDGIWAPDDYELSNFSDDHHLSDTGSERLTRDLAKWIDAKDWRPE